MQSAAASIVGFSAGQEEWLSLNTSFILPTGLSYTVSGIMQAMYADIMYMLV